MSISGITKPTANTVSSDMNKQINPNQIGNTLIHLINTIDATDTNTHKLIDRVRQKLEIAQEKFESAFNSNPIDTKKVEESRIEIKEAMDEILKSGMFDPKDLENLIPQIGQIAENSTSNVDYSGEKIRANAARINQEYQNMLIQNMYSNALGSGDNNAYSFYGDGDDQYKDKIATANSFQMLMLYVLLAGTNIVIEGLQPQLAQIQHTQKLTKEVNQLYASLVKAGDLPPDLEKKSLAELFKLGYQSTPPDADAKAIQDALGPLFTQAGLLPLKAGIQPSDINTAIDKLFTDVSAASVAIGGAPIPTLKHDGSDIYVDSGTLNSICTVLQNAGTAGGSMAQQDNVVLNAGYQNIQTLFMAIFKVVDNFGQTSQAVFGR